MGGREAPKVATLAHRVRTQGPSVREHAHDGRDGGPPLCPLPNTMCGNQALGWPPLGCWKKASPFQTSQWLLGANLECFFSSLGGSDPPPPPPPHPGGAGLGPPGGQGERLGVADKPHLSHGPECRSEKFGSWDRWGFGKRTSKPPCMGMPRGTDEQVRCCQRLHYQVPYIGQGSFGVAYALLRKSVNLVMPIPGGVGVRDPLSATTRGFGLVAARSCWLCATCRDFVTPIPSPFDGNGSIGGCE